MNILQLGIYFISPEVEKLYQKAGFQDNISSGFDLLNIEEVELSLTRPFQLVNLGVVIKPPEGFHSLLIPRSSTFKKYRILQANSLGLIDSNFSGKEDVWHFPILFQPQLFIQDNTSSNSVSMRYNIKETIPPGTRLCQFFLQPYYRFETYKYNPSEKSRGGFGSTDK